MKSLKNILGTLAFSICILSNSFSQSSQNAIPYPESKVTFSAYRIDSYVKTYCDYLEKEYASKGLITRSRLYHLAWNGICGPWLQQDGYKFESKTMDYYFIKLQSSAYAKCEILRNHYYLIFDNANASNDTIVKQHQRMMEMLAHLEDTSATAGIKADFQIQGSISNFRQMLKRFSPFLFFSITHLAGTSYQIEYFYFNPGSDIEYPLDSKNLVMNINVDLGLDSISQFSSNYAFERFGWLDKHIDDLKLRVFNAIPPPAPMQRE